MSDLKNSKIFEELASQYADSLMNTEYQNTGLVSPEQQKEKYRIEFLEEMQMNELNDVLIRALEAIIQEGKSILDATAYADLMIQINNAADSLENFNATTLVANMETIAIDCFHKGSFEECTHIYSLLIVLERNQADYWYKLGISLMETGNFERAASAFDNCKTLDETKIGSYLFAAECHDALGKSEKAKVELDQAEQLLEFEENRDKWTPTVLLLKERLRRGR